jgi:hypothetical protein
MIRSRALALLAATLGLAGCFSDKTAMKVNADGSGTITVTTKMKAEAVKQMKEMAKSFGGENAKEPELFSEKEAREKVSKMGEGVEFVSYEPIKDKDSEGQKVTYSFKDVTKLKLKETSGPPGGENQGFKAEAQSEDPMTFKFAKQANGHCLLTVVTPQKKLKPDGAPEAPAAPGAAPGGEVPEEQLAMMKQMFAGLRITIELEVAGTLVKTNSPHVNGSTVTILDIDFEKMMTDMGKFKKLFATQPKSLEEAKAMIKDFPGVKVNLEPETTIEFAGK